LSWYGKDRWFKSSPGLLNDLSTKSVGVCPDI
jgi:hypothetical protein